MHKRSRSAAVFGVSAHTVLPDYKMVVVAAYAVTLLRRAWPWLLLAALAMAGLNASILLRWATTSGGRPPVATHNAEAINPIPAPAPAAAYVYHSRPPRTLSAPYNELPEGKARASKLLMYEPSGGFTNQLLVFARAATLAIRFDRVLVVPMVSKHHTTNPLGRRHMSPEHDMLELDRVLDFERLFAEGGLKGIVLNCTELDFERHLRATRPELSWEEHAMPLSSTRSNFRVRKADVARFGESDADVLRFRGAILYGAMHGVLECVEDTQNSLRRPGLRRHGKYGCLAVQRYMRFGRWWRGLGIRAAASFGSYSAVHMRLGDYIKRYAVYEKRGRGNKAMTAGYFYKKRMLIHNMSRTDPACEEVYVATEVSPKSKTALAVIRDGTRYRTMTSADLPADVLSEFDAAFELPAQQDLRNDMLLPLEFVVLTLAKLFIGVSWSNVANYVMFLRDPAWLVMTLPEEAKRLRVRCDFESERRNGVVLLESVSPVRAAECARCPEASGKCDGDCQWEHDLEGGACQARTTLRTHSGNVVNYSTWKHKAVSASPPP